MSIPPLVCSTPPPPDQCEDEKDHEDYDIHYNLSQDEDDDNYDFGSFSTFNHFQSSQNKSNPIITKVVDSDKVNVSPNDLQDIPGVVNVDIAEQNKQKFEEETNIEDLNLEDLKADQDTIDKIPDQNEDSNVEIKISNPNIESVQEPVMLQSVSDVDSTAANINTCDLQPDELDIEPCSIDQPEEPPSYVDDIIAAVENLQMTPTEPDLPLDITENDEPMQEFKSTEIDKQEFTEASEVEKQEFTVNSDIEKQEFIVASESEKQEFTVSSEIEKQEITATYEKVEHKEEIDDDFGDFDDFQFASPSNIPTSDKPATLLSCDNPWDKNDETTDDDFEVQLATGSEDLELPFLDVQLPEDKLMEFVNNIINEIYEEEIPEPEEENEATLDSVLGVTWGHLLQTDERQPYMVNWNNSLGQKTLLKALCIDSRNILFGPKWSYNMPKYAATLTAAPLQPLKQITSPSSSQVDPHPEKSTSKASGTWSDPFTSDGQEFTYAEALLLDLEHLMATLDQMAHNHSTLKISELLSHACNPDAPSENPVIETGPTDLDVFEASTSSKPDKIFSSTLNIQPLRQISLPDTHIFTPTDSETPRSTTIHYDNSPTVLLPQTVIETKSETSFKSEHQTLPPKASADDTDEYWEFQDFKGSKTAAPSNTPSSTSETSKPNPNVVNPPQQTPTAPAPIVVNKPDLEIAGPSKVLAANERPTTDTPGDDDFDTFQSALPSTSSVPFNFSNVSKDSNTTVGKPTISSPAPPAVTTDFDFAFPKVDNVKSNTISFENVNKPKESFVKTQLPIFPNNVEAMSLPVQVSSTVMNTGLLQPTPASMNATLPSQQKTGQILQPLSLESFSQINWPNPGIDLQDLSRFNPVETLHSLKSDLSVNSQSKVASPVHSQKNQKGASSNQSLDDDWGDFVSSAPKPQQPTVPKNLTTFADDDEWTDFVSSPSVKPQNGLNTISLNVHTNFQSKPIKLAKGKKAPLEIPTLNYITPKSGNHKSYNDRHLNL
ncbi:clathrin-binding box of aftiphilin, vesicle trafficking domain-containing protein [Phthorimaea operculella]|nr:clathrin-binding box of aftiphilin, vesicle trafficking domain-containing protein [Phthorimaea operculella]